MTHTTAPMTVQKSNTASKLLASLDVVESSLSCPRCQSSLTGEEFYGICQSCATELRGKFPDQARTDVDAGEYEPKMNVTPNAVALKE